MKRILVLASVVGLMLSCNKIEEIPGNVSPEIKNVSFDTYLGKQTRGVSKDAFKMGDQFCTFGIKTGGTNFDVKVPVFAEYVFDNVTKSANVSHLGLDPVSKQAIWNYGDPTPWDEQNATFFAYSPVPQGAVSFGITNSAIADNTIPTIDFEVTGGYDPAIVDLNSPVVSAARALIKEQTDLMWAYSPDNTKSTGTIGLEFRHSLSQIRFSARGYHNQGLLRINSVTLKNVMTKGTLSLAHDESSTAVPKPGDVNYLGGWKTPSTPKNFAVNLQTETVSAIPPIAAGTTIPITWPITDDDESLMMIPQALTGLQLEVRYSYSSDGMEWTDYVSGTAMDFVLATLSSHWNPNKRYNYILSIYPGKAINFTTTIDQWEPYGGDADLEYREFNISSVAGSISVMANGVDELFELKEGDKITVTYANGTGWLSGVDPAATSTVLGAQLTVTAINAGKWGFKTAANASGSIRKATLIIERADYDKVLPDGSTVKVKGGKAKYQIAQAN